MRIILASQSPERLNLLKQIGLNPIVIVSKFEENLSKTLPPHEFVTKTAEGKLGVVVEEAKKDGREFDVIVAADTVIAFEGEIIGKPTDDDEARKTLNRLSGLRHAVFTGVSLYFSDGEQHSFHVETSVLFRKLCPTLIEDYVATKEPIGRAGSYGIQRKGSVLVERIDGCHSNIVGLPLSKLAEELEKKGLRLWG